MKWVGVLLAFALVGLGAYALGVRVHWPASLPQKNSMAAAKPATSLQPIAPLPQTIAKPVSTPVPETEVASVPVLAPQAKSPEPVELPSSASAPEESVALQQPEAAGEQAQVYVFWQPFTTRSSALGFATALTARSDVPVEVIEDLQGEARQYRVVLPYVDETQRQQRLAKLAATTRLEIR